MKNRNGLLTVVKRNGKKITCLCDCGETIQINLSKFYRVQSCGCLKKRILKARSKIHEGDRFGFLEAKKSAGKDKSGNHFWECVCFCGNNVRVRSSNLLSGKSKSCGCVSSALRNETYYNNHPTLAKKYIKTAS